MKDIQAFQGDVLFRQVEEFPKEAKKLNHLILAEGETTGHKHQVIGNAVLYEIPDNPDKFLDVVGDEVTIKHEEHKTLVLPRGKYRVGIAKEYDHFAEEARQVRD